VERRKFGALAPGVSAVGISLAGLVRREVLGPDAPLAVGLLRRARELGFTVFDADAGVRTATAERWISAALEPDDDEAVVFSTLSGDRPGAPEGGVSDAVRAARRRLAGRRVDVLFVPAPLGMDPVVRESITSLVQSGELGGWGVRLTEGMAALGEARDLLHVGVRSFKLPYNLINREPAETILALGHSLGSHFVVTDPHGRGLLDGTALRSGVTDPTQPPPSVRELAGQYAPVLSLARLTAHGSRTLPQAAVQFALLAPGVSTVLVAPDGVEQLNALADLERLPSLEMTTRSTESNSS
jgi:aryl-alcohol dehydrogenase-like predicted oxidoreductase